MKKVYLYNKTTLTYAGSREARLDILETKKQGYDIYARPSNGTFTEPPAFEDMDGKVIMYNKKSDSWDIVNSNIGKYVINTKLNVITQLLTDRPIRSFEILVNKKTYLDMKENPDKYIIKNKELVDISGTQEYQNKVNIKKYQELIMAEKEKYDTFLNTPVKFNNALYLPRYLDDYCKLQLRSFPQEIWDYSGLNSKLMSQKDFMLLKNYLEDLVNSAYKEKKENIKKYKLAISKLESNK